MNKLEIIKSNIKGFKEKLERNKKYQKEDYVSLGSFHKLLRKTTLLSDLSEEQEVYMLSEENYQNHLTFLKERGLELRVNIEALKNLLSTYEVKNVKIQKENTK